MSDKEINYGEIVERLEVIVQELRKPEIKIDDSIALYKEGKELIKQSKEYLDAKTKEIEQIK